MNKKQQNPGMCNTYNKENEQNIQKNMSKISVTVSFIYHIVLTLYYDM